MWDFAIDFVSFYCIIPHTVMSVTCVPHSVCFFCVLLFINIGSPTLCYVPELSSFTR